MISILQALQDSGLPRLEAEVLLAWALSKPRSYFLARPEQLLTHNELTQFNDMVKRRISGEPVAYIIGQREFWSLVLTVTPDTLIPRPETELMVEEVLRRFSETETVKLADLGTGSGAIALALASERPAWQVYATDISDSALSVASNNAHQLGINNISFCQGNWCTALPCRDMDVIVSNPPYIAETEWETYAAGLAFEPRSALVSGQDGLDDIRSIVASATSYLKSNGWLFIEHGFTQANEVREIFAAYGYSEIYSVLDIEERERITLGKWYLC